mgnify:CR=1 FL=1
MTVVAVEVLEIGEEPAYQDGGRAVGDATEQRRRGALGVGQDEAGLGTREGRTESDARLSNESTHVAVREPRDRMLVARIEAAQEGATHLAVHRVLPERGLVRVQLEELELARSMQWIGSCKEIHHDTAMWMIELMRRHGTKRSNDLDGRRRVLTHVRDAQQERHCERATSSIDR